MVIIMFGELLSHARGDRGAVLMKAGRGRRSCVVIVYVHNPGKIIPRANN